MPSKEGGNLEQSFSNPRTMKPARKPAARPPKKPEIEVGFPLESTNPKI